MFHGYLFDVAAIVENVRTWQPTGVKRFSLCPQNANGRKKNRVRVSPELSAGTDLDYSTNRSISKCRFREKWLAKRRRFVTFVQYLGRGNGITTKMPPEYPATFRRVQLK